MIKITKLQKKYLLFHENDREIGEISKFLKCTPQELMDEYDNLLATREYFKIKKELVKDRNTINGINEFLFRIYDEMGYKRQWIKNQEKSRLPILTDIRGFFMGNKA